MSKVQSPEASGHLASRRPHPRRSRTSNIEHPTSNIEPEGEGSAMRAGGKKCYGSPANKEDSRDQHRIYAWVSPDRLRNIACSARGAKENEARTPRRGLIMEETLADVPR